MHAAAEPVPPPTPGADAAPRFQVHAWRPALRLLAIAAQTIGTGSLLYLAAAAFQGSLEGLEPLVPFGLILRLALQLVALLLLPWALAALLRRVTSGTLTVEPSRLVLQLRGVHFEIPRDSVSSVEPWKLPLPGAGLALRMKSGRRFQYQLQVENPAALLSTLGLTLPTAATASAHPGTRFGQALHDLRRRFWDKPAFKFGLFPLLPTGVMFRAHQYITFGGPFGEYDLLGLAAYLKTFAAFWHSFALGLLLYAGVWRIAAELLAFGLTWLLPSRAHGVRQFAEWVCRLAYYVGAPAIMVQPFL
ncbi:hypothetical protein [Hyalangium versicolor]|uniref:hypothetical protein n=1 Tax=Hyalangium versicolor TaxID=2861190 RepID=UPI001CCF641D|nr:hypothetical protein [Hyalangium versicolor]